MSVGQSGQYGFYNIKLRFSATWSNLIIGHEIKTDITAALTGQYHTGYRNPGVPCGMPNLVPFYPSEPSYMNPTGVESSFIATSTTEVYYIDVTFQELLSNINEFAVNKCTILFETTDTTLGAQGNSPVAYFQGNIAMWQKAETLAQLSTPCPCIP